MHDADVIQASRPLVERLGLNHGRGRTLWMVVGCLAAFVALFASASLMSDSGLDTNLTARKLPPSLEYWFGTDWLGRDMFVRTIKGLRLSLGVGLFAATFSSVISVILGLASATLGGKVDAVITGLVDSLISLPHLVLLILISFAVGGGSRGVILAVALTHWPRLARIIRAETLQIMSSDYVKLSTRLGRSSFWIAKNHMVPHILPQFLIGLILLFPHAILHAAGLTFLGFGLSPHQPAIGVLLSESMRHLSTGYWWLAIFPGVCLVATVKLFDIMGTGLRTLVDPKTSQD